MTRTRCLLVRGMRFRHHVRPDLGASFASDSAEGKASVAAFTPQRFLDVFVAHACGQPGANIRKSVEISGRRHADWRWASPSVQRSNERQQAMFQISQPCFIHASQVSTSETRTHAHRTRNISSSSTKSHAKQQHMKLLRGQNRRRQLYRRQRPRTQIQPYKQGYCKCSGQRPPRDMSTAKFSKRTSR